MKLIFESKDSTQNFVKWLKAFKEIDNSLLIEVDLTQKLFIAKVTTQDQALVRYSQISFENAGFIANENIIDNDEKEVSIENFTSRINVGIFLTLDKFINRLSVVADAEYTMTIEFDENIISSSKTTWDATNIHIESKTLALENKTANISEFVYISDDIFNNKIYVVPTTPYHTKVDANTIKTLLSISALYSIDETKDVIQFTVVKDEETDKYKLVAIDGVNQQYKYALGFIENEDDKIKDFSLSVFRHKFIMATKGINTTLDISMAIDATRVLIDTEDGDYKTVVAIVRH